jgi:hypothetical protein
MKQKLQSTLQTKCRQFMYQAQAGIGVIGGTGHEKSSSAPPLTKGAPSAKGDDILLLELGFYNTT